MRILTRGLTGSAGALVVQGFGPVLLEVVRIARAGRSAASRAVKDLTESFKMTAMLISHNGAEVFKPIAQNIRKTFVKNEIVIRQATPLSIEHRKSKDIEVIVETVKIRNKKNVKH
jgi:hypothetical protein